MTAIDQLGTDECPSAYQMLATLACPPWCELPADHEVDSSAGRVHRAAQFTLDDRASVSVAEVIFGETVQPTRIEVDFQARGEFTTEEALQVHAALEKAFARRAEILAEIAADGAR